MDISGTIESNEKDFWWRVEKAKGLSTFLWPSKEILGDMSGSEF